MADSYGALDPELAVASPEIDVTKPHPARMYDYFLGGKDNFAADRATAAQVLDSWGSVRRGGMRGAIRTSEEFGELALTGLELVDPGAAESRASPDRSGNVNRPPSGWPGPIKCAGESAECARTRTRPCEPEGQSV
jgi:hypothetical protein